MVHGCAARRHVGDMVARRTRQVYEACERLHGGGLTVLQVVVAALPVDAVVELRRRAALEVRRKKNQS